MATQFRHPPLRPLGTELTALDRFLDDHRIGFALVSANGLMLAANDLFLARTDLPHAMIGTLPVSHLAHVWAGHVSERDGQTLVQWLTPHEPSNESWNGSIREHPKEGDQIVTLFRATLSLSGKERLFLFQSSPGEGTRPGTIAHHFPFMKDHLLPIILDLRDYDAMLPLFLETDPSSVQTTVLLSEEARWFPETSFLRITSRQKKTSEHPQWISLLSERMSEPFPPPSRRPTFSRDLSIPEQLFLNMPLFRETSFYGWIIWPFTGAGSHRGTVYKRRSSEASDLSDQLHRIRTDLLLIPVLETERTTGLYSHRGILKALQDLMSKGKAGRAFGLIGITLADPAGIDPLSNHLRTFLRGSDLLGHNSPMEFLLVVTDSDREKTQKTFRRLLSVLRPIALADYRLNARIGLCQYPEDASTPIRILRKAFLHNAVHIGQAYQSAPFSTPSNYSQQTEGNN